VSPEIILVALFAVAAGLLAGLLLARRPPAAVPPTLADSGLLDTLQKLQQDLGGLRENVAKLPSAAELTGVKERLEGMEGRVPADLAGSVDKLKEGLTRMETEFRARYATLQKIEKIEAVLLGAQSRGAAGEVVLAEAFAQFPAEMGETQFKVNGKPVEFALVLPNNKRLPIDSKWPAVKELEQYSQEQDETARQELLGKIEKAVLKKVEEVTKYIDAATTASVAVAAIPDAAYFACRTAHIDAYRQRVLLMPYSLTIPFLLALYNLHLQFARSIEQENLDAYLSQMDALLTQIEDKLENSVQRGVTMISNAYSDLRGQISQMRGTLTTLRGLPTESLAEKQHSLLKD